MKLKDLALLTELDDDDDLDDSSPYERDREYETQIKNVLIKLGFDKHDIIEVSVDDTDVTVILDTGIHGISLTQFNKLYKSNMSDEYFIAPGQSTNLELKFKTSKKLS